MTTAKIARTATRRAALVLAGTLTTLLVPFAAPIGIAHACGCGAYSPQKGGTASVPSETALVRSAGDGSEDIYISLTLDSDVRTGALLFPVPDRHAKVSAGPTDMFDELAALTTPRPSSAPGSEDGNGAGAPAPSVTVENRQQIGPLDVVTLSSGDPGALTSWLQHNGFTAKPALTQAAEPYTSAGWAFVAVRLRPGTAGATTLHGRLDPLHLHFASSEIVYPMRLSAMAAEPEQVTVYTLGRHQLGMDTRTPGMHLSYSARVEAAQLPDLAALFAGGTDVLTRLDGVLTPSTIADDFHFRDTGTAPETTSPTRTFNDYFPASSGPSIDRVGLSGGSGSNDAGGTIGLVVGVLGALALLGIGIVVHQRRRPDHQ